MELILEKLTPQTAGWGCPHLGKSLGQWDLRAVSGMPKVGGVNPERPPTVLRGSDGRDLWVTEDGERLYFWRPEFALLLNLAERKGKAYISSPEEWQNVFRILYFFEFLEYGGVLLHASSIMHRGNVFIFPGPSGAGKTTIVRLSRGMPILSDEISAVDLPTGDQPFVAYGTPFYGYWEHPREKVCAPVKGLFFPVKASEHRILPLSSKETLNRLLPCVCTYSTWGPRQRKLFDLGARLADRVPGYLFYFRPHPSLWEALDEC
jgi:hypothetical protein